MESITAKEFVESSRWISGPEFLWTPKDQWPPPIEDQDLAMLSDDPEVKKVTSYATSTQEPWNLDESLSYFSVWHRACGAVAICLRYKRRLRQLVYFKKDRCAVPARHKSDVKTTSPLYRIDPFLDHDGVLQVGGRI